MKRMLLLVFIGLGFACGKIQAQTEYIFPSNKEYVGSYSGGSLSYQNGNLKITTNSYLSLSTSNAPFWNGCTNFVWNVSLPGGRYTFYGRDCSVQVKGTGGGMISIDAIDKDGRRHRNCSFMIEVKD